jgi:hypothetical protein
MTFLSNIQRAFSSEIFNAQVSAAYVTTGVVIVL